MPVLTGLRNAILEMDTVCHKLAQWDFGSGIEPAVFTTDELSDACECPFIEIEHMGGAMDQCTRTRRGGTYTVQIACYKDHARTGADVRLILETIVDTLHHHESVLTIEGYQVANVSCTPLKAAAHQRGLSGYSTEVSLLLLEDS